MPDFIPRSDLDPVDFDNWPRWLVNGKYKLALKEKVLHPDGDIRPHIDLVVASEKWIQTPESLGLLDVVESHSVIVTWQEEELFLLDTGAATSVISISLAERLEIDFPETPEVANIPMLRGVDGSFIPVFKSSFMLRLGSWTPIFCKVPIAPLMTSSQLEFMEDKNILGMDCLLPHNLIALSFNECRFFKKTR